jgi:hypothetical protein
VLSPEEVTRLIEATPSLLYRTLLLLLYGIDSSLMLIDVHQGKGSHGREVPLTQKVLEPCATDAAK